MGFDYVNIQKHMIGGKKITRKVIIKNGKGYKSICSYRNGKKCYNTKKQPLTKSDVQMIKLGKFIPGLFRNILPKTLKNKK